MEIIRYGTSVVDAFLAIINDALGKAVRSLGEESVFGLRGWRMESQRLL
jgi:hypothetical protein